MNCLEKYHSQLLRLITTHLQCIGKALYASDFLPVAGGEEDEGEKQQPTVTDDETKAAVLLDMVEKRVKTTEIFFTFIGILTSTGIRELACFAEKIGKEYWSLSLERRHSQLQVEPNSLSSYQMETPSNFAMEPQSSKADAPIQNEVANGENALLHFNQEMPVSGEVRSKPFHICSGDSSGEFDESLEGHYPQPQFNEEPHCGEVVLPSLKFKEESTKLIHLYNSVSKTLSRRKTLRGRTQEDEAEINTTSEEIEGIESDYKIQYDLIQKELRLADIAHKSEREYVEKRHKRTVHDILARQKRREHEMCGELSEKHHEQEMKLMRTIAANEEELRVLHEKHEDLKKQLSETKEKLSAICKIIAEKNNELTLRKLVQRKEDIEVFLDDLKIMKQYIITLRDHAWNKSLSEEKIDGYLAALKDRVAIIKERRNSRSWPRN